MTLTLEDKKYIKDVVIDSVTAIIEKLVLPRLDVLDSRVAVLERDVAQLKQDVFYLQNDMRQVKKWLGSVDGRLTAVEADIKELYLILR